MSRRDTIIIAVLLNAGLLIVLFATSLKSDKVDDEPSAITVLASSQTSKDDIKEGLQSTKTASATSPAFADPVDRVIEQYVPPQIANQAANSDQPNFLADLQARGDHAPQPAAPQAAASAANYKEVKVKKGDVLERIAQQNHASVSEIMKANKLTSTRLTIGQVLKIPDTGSAKTVAAAAASGGNYYTVKAGDNPWTIAVKHHMKVEELLKLNNMDEQKAKRLKVGDKIRVN